MTPGKASISSQARTVQPHDQSEKGLDAAAYRLRTPVGYCFKKKSDLWKEVCTIHLQSCTRSGLFSKIESRVDGRAVAPQCMRMQLIRMWTGAPGNVTLACALGVSLRVGNKARIHTVHRSTSNANEVTTTKGCWQYWNAGHNCVLRASLYRGNARLGAVAKEQAARAAYRERLAQGADSPGFAMPQGYSLVIDACAVATTSQD